ncbi:MAG: right-handed parallel beta-helix repeat-containing protein [Ardenticatenaceae bacterium]|nr:right-handed parallel beta-helix repeat-containing protein [Anaerolineales bacterium]MCB8921546.1 right-handed parallel beta-helix repeat-containing protein [Ardenticatenaceae bacterium]MCB8991463.1 right-handed parallel beta-helix repeat-containing protein [Ardenticatenaceae bacterium]MCB9003917.1 right-handed parallel beta-helix repeat-containing protein [Ardenticatenaceae bacterium]
MKRLPFIFMGMGLVTAVTLLALFSHTGTAAPAATTYYVCDCQPGADGDCVAGSDANTGTSPSAPWQTYDKARTVFNSTIQAGDEIRFCDGGFFDLGGGNAMWFTQACTAVQPCTVANYTPPWASGNEGLPILSRPIDDHAFDLSNPGDALSSGGFIFQNLDLRCPGCTGAWGFLLYNDVNDLVIDNVRMDGFGIGIHLAGANPCSSSDPLCDGQNDHITISNVRITNGDHMGILGGANDLLIENSYFENNGGGTVFDHNIYVSSGTGITIRNNELYRSSLDGSGSCNGTSLVGHGVMTDLLIEGNVVREDVGKATQACWGIAITPAYGSAEVFTNVTIRGNRVENVGNMAIGTGSCLNCTIENNVIVNQQAFGVTAVSVPAQSPQAGDAISSNLVVRNNSIAVTTGIAIEVSSGSGHTIVSNAIQATASDSNWNCLHMPLAASSYNAIDYNVCGFDTGKWALDVGDLAAWQSQGWGANSQAADPGFASSSNLRPSTETAVLIKSGHPTLSSPTDFDGNVRAAPPAAGAYEWLVLDMAAWLPLVVTP